MGHRLIIIISSGEIEREILNSNLMIFSDGKKHSERNNNVLQYSFILINEECFQSNTFASKIRKNDSKEICIAVHNGGGKLGKVKIEIKNKKNVFPAIPFSHEEREPWLTIKKVLECVKDGNQKKYSSQFDKLWKLLVSSDADRAHRLRSQILYPFTNLHLALQGKLENDTIKECKKNIDAINTSLIGDLVSLASDNGVTIEKDFKYLQDLVKKPNEKNTIIEKIETFASNLESIVNSIEFGETPIIKPLDNDAK